MESSNPNTTHLLEENATISALRRRNKKLIITFTIFIISLSLIIASLIFYLIVLEEENSTSSSDHQFIPPQDQSSPNTTNFNPIISATESDNNQTNPNVHTAFTLSLETAAKKIEHLISFVSTSYSADDRRNETVVNSFRNCSDSLVMGLDGIREVSEALRDDPFVEIANETTKGELRSRMFMVEGRLHACLSHLSKVESTAAFEARLRVRDAIVCVSSSGEFLASRGAYEYKKEQVISWEKYIMEGEHWGWMIVENLFVICVCGLQMFFMFVLFWTLCRYR